MFSPMLTQGAFGPTGPGMLDPQEISRAERARREFEERRAALHEEQEAYAQPQAKSFGRNFLSEGLPALLAGAATGGFAIPMALAFGLGATSRAGQAQRERDREAPLEMAQAQYDMANEELRMFDPEAGGQRQFAQQLHRVRDPNNQNRWVWGRFDPGSGQIVPTEFEAHVPGSQPRVVNVTASDGSNWTGWADPATMMFYPGQMGPQGQGVPISQLPPDVQHAVQGQFSHDQGQPAPTPQGMPGSPAPSPEMATGVPGMEAPGPAPAPGMPPAGPQTRAPQPAGGDMFRSPTPQEEARQREAGSRQAQIDQPVPPQGWEVIPGTNRWRPIAGSEQDRNFRRAAAEAKRNYERIAPKMMRDIQEAIRHSDRAGRFYGVIADPQGENVGLFRELLQVASPAYKLVEELESVSSNIGIEELAAMRRASPTGGALGQVPFRQQQRLEQLRGRLNARMEPERLRENLAMVYNDYVEIIAETMFGGDLDLEDAVNDGLMTRAEAQYQREQRDKLIQEMMEESPFDAFGRRQPERDPLEGLSPEARRYLEGG